MMLKFTLEQPTLQNSALTAVSFISFSLFSPRLLLTARGQQISRIYHRVIIYDGTRMWALFARVNQFPFRAGFALHLATPLHLAFARLPHDFNMSLKPPSTTHVGTSFSFLANSSLRPQRVLTLAAVRG